VLKAVWRERHAAQPGWIEKYYALALRSEPVRRGALIVLENMLG
jgi:hypothetical protein